MIFKGTGVALVTPFQKDGSVDESRLAQLVNDQAENGTDFLVVQGTTGEAATLASEEKMRVLDVVIEANHGRLPIILGMGGNNTAQLAWEMENFKNQHVDGFLSASPHYNKPSQRGIIEHFETIARKSKRPLILYNVPGRTGSNMTAETIIHLSKLSNIVGVKEASGDFGQVMEIINHVEDDFAVLSGEDALTMPMIAAGAHGVISVVTNAFPQQYAEMINSAFQGDFQRARAIHYHLLTLTNMMFEEGNPAGVKYCLELLDKADAYLRLPLVEISEELKSRIIKEMKMKKLV